MHATPRLAALAAAALGSALGCATTETANDRVNPEVPQWYSRPSGSMNVLVRRQLTATSRQEGENYERGRPEIDSAHGRIFVGSADRGLYALRADGSTIWRFETLGVVQCEPRYDPELDYVYFGSHDGALYAVRAGDGSLVWRFNTGGGEVARQPALLGESLYFANGSDFLFAIDRRTGKLKWQQHRTPALGMEVAGYAGPTADAQLGLVYMAYSDGHVIAYDARDGAERWTPVDLSAEAEHQAGEAPRYLDVDTTPVVDDHPGGRVVYVASYAAGVYALDAQTGSRVWSNDKAIGVTDLLLWSEPAHKPNPNGPDKDGPTVPARKVLVASSGVSGMWGLDVLTGRMLWRAKVPEGGITAPSPIAGAMVVGTSRYGLFLVSPLNGRVIDGIDVGPGFAQTPATFANRAYAIDNAGVLVGVMVDHPLGRRR
jgi:outer membrane protein assembly factor BamB